MQRWVPFFPFRAIAIWGFKKDPWLFSLLRYFWEKRLTRCAAITDSTCPLPQSYLYNMMNEGRRVRWPEGGNPPTCWLAVKPCVEGIVLTATEPHPLPHSDRANSGCFSFKIFVIPLLFTILRYCATLLEKQSKYPRYNMKFRGKPDTTKHSA